MRVNVVCAIESESNRIRNRILRKWIHLVVRSKLDLKTLTDAEKE